MERRRIIVGIDGSEGSRQALRWALAEAAKQDTVIEAVTVWQSPFGFGDTFGVHLDESKIEQVAHDRLEKTVAEVAGTEPAVPIEQVVLEGDPATVLCARSGEAALMVVGSLGHNSASSVALGSVAMRCAQHARGCPVVIVPKDEL